MRLGTSEKQISKSIMTIHMLEKQEAKQAKPVEAHSVSDRVYIFVADGMNIGGIETLLIRMANQIADLGYRVIIVAQNGPCMESVSNKVSIIPLVANQSLFSQIKQVRVDDLTDKGKVFIWAAVPYTLVSIYKYQRHLNRKKNVESVSVSGIFGPARSMQGLSHVYDMMEHLLVLGWLPRSSVYFMSKAVQHTYVEQFGNHFANWPIHKLTLDRFDSNWHPRESNELKIVSVGRIAKLKPYNFGALDVVESLLARNIPIKWHIWGHGDEAEMLQKSILDRGLSSSVIFHGELPYSQFRQVVLNFDLFVGMGTAALEAASGGVPTVVALAWSRLGTYGFLDQCPADSIGEHYAGTEEKNLIDVVASYSSYSKEQRTAISLRCREAVSRKTSDDPPPFDSIFEGGVQYPSSIFVSARMKSFGVAQNVWAIIKGTVNFARSASRLVRRNV